MDDIWVGLEDFSKVVTTKVQPMPPAVFERLLEETGLHTPGALYHEWTYKLIGRYLHGVLYNLTTGDLQGAVERVRQAGGWYRGLPSFVPAL